MRVDTYFIRHTKTLDIDQNTRNRLWDERRIAIHFPDAVVGSEWPDRDSTSLDPTHYKGSGRVALARLASLAASGGYVFAEHHARRETMVGLVEPNSRVEIWGGTWGKRLGRAGQVAVLKSIRLSRVRLIDPSRIVPLSAGRPRQGTIMRWPRAGDDVVNLVEGRASKPGLRNLSPQQQEIICSEYLRTTQASESGLPILAKLLLPVGGTLRDIDILGLTPDGSRIFAQVTFGNSKKSASKLDQLKKYAGRKCHLVFFCECERQSFRDGVHEVPIGEVYEALKKDKIGRLWLKAAAGE